MDEAGKDEPAGCNLYFVTIGNIGGIAVERDQPRHNLGVRWVFTETVAMQTRTILSSIPLPLAEQLDAIAERFDISYDEIVADAISVWIAREEERRFVALRNLVSTNGMFVEVNRVIDWADSL